MIHNYTWRRTIRVVIVTSAPMDYVLVPGNSRSKLLDVNVLRGEAAGMSDHYLVEAKITVIPNWKVRSGAKGIKEMIKTSALRDAR